jgi:hypothetical protein
MFRIKFCGFKQSVFGGSYLNNNPFCQSEQKSMVMATEK